MICIKQRSSRPKTQSQVVAAEQFMNPSESQEKVDRVAEQHQNSVTSKPGAITSPNRQAGEHGSHKQLRLSRDQQHFRSAS